MVELFDFDNGGDALRSPIARSVPVGDGSFIDYRCSVTFDRGLSIVRYDGRYDLRRDGEVLAHENEELLLKVLAPSRFLRALSQAGFANPRVAAMGPDTEWMRISGCRLYACEAPST